jgi:hypothetical protein
MVAGLTVVVTAVLGLSLVTAGPNNMIGVHLLDKVVEHTPTVSRDCGVDGSGPIWTGRPFGGVPSRPYGHLAD